MKKFLKAFFPHDGIYETLLGTTGIKPIIKPIGVIVNGYDLKIKVYRNTLTFANLQNTNKFCCLYAATIALTSQDNSPFWSHPAMVNAAPE